MKAVSLVMVVKEGDKGKGMVEKGGVERRTLFHFQQCLAPYCL